MLYNPKTLPILTLLKIKSDSRNIEEMMPNITVKQAVSCAKTIIADLFSDEPLKDLALEEIEFINRDGKEIWKVTLGFYRARSVNPTNQIGAIFHPKTDIENRAYKTIEIDADTGDFVKMSIRHTP